jgi:plastocyanin
MVSAHCATRSSAARPHCRNSRRVRRWQYALVVGPVWFALSCAAPAPTLSPATQSAPQPSLSVDSCVIYVEAAEQYFNPDRLTVRPGTTVVWKDVQGTHDMVADNGSFASAVLFEGGTYSHLFTAPGNYRYICTLHVGAGMWAEIDVE